MRPKAHYSNYYSQIPLKTRNLNSGSIQKLDVPYENLESLAREKDSLAYAKSSRMRDIEREIQQEKEQLELAR
jgi:hypothetical protein